MRQYDSESDDVCDRGATTVRDSTRRNEDGSDDVCDRGATPRTKGRRLESDRESCYRQSGLGATVGLHAGKYMFPTTGAMRTTATDTLEAHAKLLPLEHRLQNLCFQAAIQIAA